MELGARREIPLLTALLSIVSLALVFGAALRVVPPSSLPQAPPRLLGFIPHVNAVVSTVAIVTILAGVRFIRRGEVTKHRAMMLTSFVLFAVFLALYLYKVALVGPSTFPGPETAHRFVYLPLLAVHILLAIVCVPLLYYVLLLAATRPVSAIYDTPHKRVGRVAASLWVVSFVLGNAVYLLLYVVY